MKTAKTLGLACLAVFLGFECIGLLERRTAPPVMDASATPIRKEWFHAGAVNSTVKLKMACSVEIDDLSRLRKQQLYFQSLIDQGIRVPDQSVFDFMFEISLVKTFLKKNCIEVVDPIIMEAALLEG